MTATVLSFLYSGGDTYVAQVAEAEVTKSGEVRVHGSSARSTAARWSTRTR
jgi:CO/xanthine dehydrogenase Mo-binding subunit